MTEQTHPLASTERVENDVVLGRVKQWLPALFVVLLTLALRLHGLEQVRHNYDRAYPHGLGLFIRDAIANGADPFGLPKVSLVASINFPNPVGASYFYALLTAIEPSAYVATALNAMLGAVVAAVAFSLARRTFGVWAATAAGVFVGSGVWASWVSRGSWLQGPVEVMAALTLWLLMNGLTGRKPRHVFAAFVWVALCMQTYLVAFGLLAQAVVALIVASVPRSHTSLRPVRSAVIAGLAICAVSLLAYAGAVASERAPLDAVLNNPNAINEETRAGGANLDPLNHALRIASGRDFENTFVENDTPGFALRDQVSDLRATAVDVLMLVGLGMMVVVAFRVPSLPQLPRRLSASPRRAEGLIARVMLAWVVLPVVGTFLIANFVMRDWKVHVFYLLLTSPVPYVLAGAPFELVSRVTCHVSRAARYTVAGLCVALGALVIAIPWWNADGDVQAAARFPYNHDGLYSLPLKQQMRLADAWRSEGCATLNGQEHSLWLASLLGDFKPVRGDELRVQGDSTIWQVQPEGGACALLIDGAPAPADARMTAIALNGEKRTDRTPAVVALYTSPRYAQAFEPSKTNLTLNLGEGWRLLDLHTPERVRPGDTITVTHVWQVGMPPSEPYGAWYYAPFVKLFAPGGRQVLQIDNAPAILGYIWRTGSVQASAVRFAVPADLPAGDYALEMSLFDPNQKKNAVYFDPVALNEPVVTIRRALTISNE